MTVKIGFVIALLGAIVVSVAPAQAGPIDIEGERLDGVLTINGGANNLFDPALGKVPPGYGNSLAPGSGGPFAFVSDSQVEFGYEGGSVAFLFTVDVTSAGLITVNANNFVSPFSSVGVSIVSPVFPGLSITPFTNPFGSCSLTGDAFVCSFTSVTPFSFTSTTQLTPVPEPASMSLLGLGLAGLVARRFRLGQRT